MKKYLFVGALAMAQLVGCNSSDDNTTDETNTEDGIAIVMGGAEVEPITFQTNEMLIAHNTVRQTVNIPNLEWDNELATYAQAWATEIATNRNCVMEHRPEDGEWALKHGENLSSFSALMGEDSEGNRFNDRQNISPTNAAQGWVDERNDYTYDTNSCADGKVCGHYTQMVWKDSTKVGCGASYCANSSQIWVCNYNPAGNYNGQKPY